MWTISTRGTGSWPAERLLALSGVCAPLLLAASVVVASALEPGYSHRQDTISELAKPGVSHPRVLEAGFIAYGALMLPLGVALLRYLGARASHFLLLALFAAYSFALVLAGVFRDDSTWVIASDLSAGELHDYLALAGYGAALGIMLLTAWVVRRRREWGRFAWYSVAGVLCAGGFGLLFQLEHAMGLGGLYQRGFSGTMVLWVCSLSLRLIGSMGEGWLGRKRVLSTGDTFGEGRLAPDSLPWRS